MAVDYLQRRMGRFGNGAISQQGLSEFPFKVSWEKRGCLVTCQVTIFWSRGASMVKGEGEPTYTKFPCWKTATLPPRNQCTGCLPQHLVKRTKKMLKYVKMIIILVKRLKVVLKCCSHWMFFIATSTVVLNTQIQNIKTGSLKPILNNDAQKRIAKSIFGRKFHEFK